MIHTALVQRDRALRQVTTSKRACSLSTSLFLLAPAPPLPASCLVLPLPAARSRCAARSSLFLAQYFLPCCFYINNIYMLLLLLLLTPLVS